MLDDFDYREIPLSDVPDDFEVRELAFFLSFEELINLISSELLLAFLLLLHLLYSLKKALYFDQPCTLLTHIFNHFVLLFELRLSLFLTLVFKTIVASFRSDTDEPNRIIQPPLPAPVILQHTPFASLASLEWDCLTEIFQCSLMSTHHILQAVFGFL